MIRPTKIINIKYIKEVFIKTSKFYEKKKNVHKKHDKQKYGKGNCFNCRKFGHFSKNCKQKLGKLKNKLNMLNIDDTDKEDLF